MSLFRDFLRQEDGAITVDWVVLTAAAAGVSIAAVGLLSDGAAFITARLDNELGNGSIAAPPPPIEMAIMDFEDGDRGGWTDGTVETRIDALGEMLVLGPNEETQIVVDFPPTRNSAEITFDLIGGDSIDNEIATIGLNGFDIALGQGRGGSGTIVFVTPDLTNVTVEFETVSEGTNLGGRHWKDSVTTVRIFVDGPGDEVNLTVHSGTNQGTNDEFFAIDNFSAIAVY